MKHREEMPPAVLAPRRRCRRHRRTRRSTRLPHPAQWLPPSPDTLCRYGTEWTATKLRWGLAVDEAERDRLQDIAAGCGGTAVEFTPAA
ncbi:hypothetical protein ACFWCB_09875 [Streptomyces sp. NPDC060048]|uniref:hypothetical protein n=1 Tax=unclassified Streptomyces TaxID=2593676 RepID=UPI0036844AF6